MSETKLKCCRELYDNLTNWNGYLTLKLEFAPDQPGFEKQLFFMNEDSNDDTVELVCFKSTILKLFMEAHNYLDEHIRKGSRPTNIWDTYYMTLGYMLTTPENKMILDIHEDCLLTLISQSIDTNEILEKELFFVQTLLTSTRNSLNKSSSMWYLYRKLYILMDQKNVINEELLLKYWISTFRNSAELHVSNYYCWNTLRWFFDVIPSCDAKQAIFEMTKSFCLKHLSDCSSWDALGYIACQTKNKNCYNTENYQFLRMRYDNYQPNYDESKGHSNDRITLMIKPQPLIDEITNFIDSLHIKDWTIFLCLLRIVITYNLHDSDFIQMWKNDINSFENIHGQVKLKNGSPSVPEREKDNLSVSNGFLHFGWKKVFLNKLKRKIAFE